MSEIRATTISDETGNGPIALTKQSAAKVFAEIGPSGGSLLKSLNVSSLDDDGTGEYGLNFVTSFSSGNYASLGAYTYNYNHSSQNHRVCTIESKSAGSVEVDTGYVNSSGVQLVYDIESAPTSASVVLFGDLA